MNDGAVIASDKHTILFCNVRFSEFIKTPREKILGSNLFDYLSKSDRSTVNTLLASATSENPSAEILLTASDGSYILAHLSLSKIIYGNSAVVCLIFTNLAERTKEFRHAKEQLRLAESKYRALVEQIPAITYMAALDDAGARLYISPQIVSILGFSPDEWLSDPESWVKQLHPEDRKRVLAEYKSSHEKGQPFRSEYRWLTRDGRTLWCYDNAVLVKDKTGKPIFFQGIVTDITEYKRATEKIYLLQSLAMAISASRNLHDALVVAIQKICNYTGWIYGEAWMPNQDGTRLERNHAFYGSIDGLEKFSEYSCGLTFTPGSGLPGRAWAEKQPLWIKDVTQDPHYLRAAIAGEVGLKMGIGFPVIADGEVVSVFVFYSLKVEEINDNLIKLILSMLSQIGLIIKRIQAEDALHESEERLRSVLD
ncbi:MAG: PAS domain-containing protein, partial [Planctomycetota bacterium]